MDYETEEIWEKACEYMKSEVLTTTYRDYIATITPMSIDNETFLLKVPSDYHKNIIERFYLNAIIKAVRFASEAKVNNIKFITAAMEAFITEEAATLLTPRETEQTTQSILNPSYTFENFVVGSNNALANAASLAVAKEPAKKYNPLFIYGGPGLGKTHLMQAIAHYVKQNSPSLKVLYITSENFLNEFISAIQNKTNIRFRKKYRAVDVLLLDDIQFLASKEATQEEFFHTFNELYEAQKQVVISSDKHPRDIPGFEERMRSRFEWGLTCDVQPPNYEMRVAILKMKAENERFYVDNQVLEYMAERAITNVRELEGILTKVHAQSELMNQMPNLENIRAMMGNAFDVIDKKITVESIISETAKHFSVTFNDILSSKRPANLALARQVAMYITRELTDLSLPEIGEAFGGKDHSTVFYAYNKIKSEVTYMPNLKNDTETIVNRLKDL